MNPKDFWWTEDQQVTVTNPTTESYRFKVHNKDYQLEAGRTAKMPGYIAWVYVYGMAVKQAQADKTWSRWNEEDFRPQYYEKFVAGVAPLIDEVQTIADPGVHTFDDADDLPAGGENYEPTVKPHGKPAKV